MSELRSSFVDQMERLFSQCNIEEIEHEHPNEWEVKTKDGKGYKANTPRAALEKVPGVNLGEMGMGAN
jgi:hypothetical protein